MFMDRKNDTCQFSSYRFIISCNLNKTPMDSPWKENWFKNVFGRERPKITKILLTENEEERFDLSDIKTYYKAKWLRQCGTGTRIDKLTNETQ